MEVKYSVNTAEVLSEKLYENRNSKKRGSD